MKKNTKLRKEYKVSLIAALLSVAMIPVILVFVLMPMYGLVGSEMSAAAIDKKFDSIQSLSMVFNVIIILSILISMIFGAIGVYKDLKEKSKTKK